jgi:hypothetical protein
MESMKQISNWQPIETAPKDGTPILVRNPAMDFYVTAKWGLRNTPWGRSYPAFIIVQDPDRIMPIAPGNLVIPTEWIPLPEPPTAQ